MGRIWVEKKNTYRPWSTITDSYITSRFLTLTEAIDFLIDEAMQDGKLKAIEYAMTFPRGFRSVDLDKIHGDPAPYDNKKIAAYYKWQINALTSDNYEKAVNDKFEKIKNENKTS